MNELKWSTRLESVRKDVGYCFGRMKGRLRILQSRISFHHQRKIDNVFVASGIPHNINLVHDCFDVMWKDPKNWETPEDEDDQDLREGRERLRLRGRLPHPDSIRLQPGINDRNVVVDDIDDVADATYLKLSKQLIDYYT